jgi:uncharacterized protein (TIGR02001 family)
MKTITLITLFVGALAFITNAYASVSANGSVSSDYLWRGDSLSDGNAVVQGGLDYDAGNFYAGVWVSTLGETFPGEEVDLYVGTDIAGFDVGVIKYEIDSTEFTELYAGYSIAGFDLYYAQDEEESDNSYMSVSYGFDITEGITGTLTYGEWSDEAVVAELGSGDFLQLDIAYGDMTLTILDSDERPDVDLAVSYSLAL